MDLFNLMEIISKKIFSVETIVKKTVKKIRITKMVTNPSIALDACAETLLPRQ